MQRKVPWVRERMGASPDETAFIRWSLNKLLAGNGFTDIEIIPFDWLHPNLPDRFIEPSAGIRTLFERLPIIREFAGSLYIHGVRPTGSS